ncbi:MAG TPA: YceI family protein [Micavibrio sp.]|jgi:polyisoprenoid-binding protein YceI
MKRLLPALAVLLLSFPVHAEVEKYNIDKPHTQIIFLANHLGFSHSIGKFTDYSGYFTFDRGSPEKSHVEVTIMSDSLDLDDAKWNEHMKGSDFLDTAKFPQMTFKSTDIKVLSDSTADITGDLTLRGVTLPVLLHTTYNKSERHPFSGKYVSGFSARGVIKRSDFGMTYGLPVLGDDVDIMLEVEGIREDSPEQEEFNNK